MKIFSQINNSGNGLLLICFSKIAAEDEGNTLRKCYCLNVSKSETKNVINIYFIYSYEFHCLKKFPNQFNLIIQSVESTLEYCNWFGPVCFNSLLPSFEDWTSGSLVIASASIVQRSPTPQTAMGTGVLSGEM